MAAQPFRGAKPKSALALKRYSRLDFVDTLSDGADLAALGDWAAAKVSRRRLEDLI